MKLFLAGNDRSDYAAVLQGLGYPYRLASYYYLKTDDRARAVLLPCVEESSRDPNTEWIMDSGLFSFMFGAKQGTLSGYADFESYAKQYLLDMDAWGWKHAIVECDVQRVLGVPETHRLRDELFRPSGREVIYVWHIPEGEQGLTELAKRERRVALGIPEFRNVMAREPKDSARQVQAAIHAGLRRIRMANRADQRCHLLGNTDSALIHAPWPADTCDSTSWVSGGRFGNGFAFDVRLGRVVSVSVYSPKWRAWRAWCEKEFAGSFHLFAKQWPMAKRFVYYGNAGCSAIAFLLWMERINGARAGAAIPTSLPAVTHIANAPPMHTGAGAE